MHKFLVIISSALIFFFVSCKKDSFITSSNAIVNFSLDTLNFDTVFTTTGSITQSVKIINGNDQKILLSNIKLMGGSNSVFKLNIDGVSETEADNVELEPNDSIYVFVSVYINQSSANLAFILADSIQVAFNGNQQYIQLRAYGQNAHFLNNTEISSNTIWANDLPYVILGGLQIDSNSTLTIQKGCKIYLHANAPMIVNGTLLAQGVDSSRIYFLGDRLDYPYNGFPGSWPGIYFQESSINNILQFAVIENAYQGIVAANLSANNNPKLSLNDCIINNIYDIGVWGIQTNITAQNCLISNCGKNIEIDYGGNYSFTNCTVASYGNDYIAHDSPVLNINNYSPINNLSADLNANFINCIFWGSSGVINNEVATSNAVGNVFNANFQNCLWRMQTVPSNITSSSILNVDPMFDSINVQTMYYDFHLKAGSSAIDAGVFTGIPYDLDGNPRVSGSATDLGCYERQQ